MNQLSNLNSKLEKEVYYNASLNPTATTLNLIVENASRNAFIEQITFDLEASDLSFGARTALSILDRGNGYTYKINNYLPVVFATIATTNVITYPVSGLGTNLAQYIAQNDGKVVYQVNQSVQDAEGLGNIYIQLTKLSGTFSTSFKMTVAYRPEVTYNNLFNTQSQTNAGKFRVLSQIGVATLGVALMTDRTSNVANYARFRDNVDTSSAGFSVTASDPIFYFGSQRKTNRFFLGFSSDNNISLGVATFSYWDGYQFTNAFSSQIFNGATGPGTYVFSHDGVIITDDFADFTATVLQRDPNTVYNRTLIGLGTLATNNLVSNPSFYWYKCQLGFTTALIPGTATTSFVNVACVVPLDPLPNRIFPLVGRNVYLLGGAIDSSISFSRASSGNYFNSSGVLTLAAINEARMDYDPATLQPKGLLMEPASTNLLGFSNDWTQSLWTKANVLVTPNAIISPDGNMNATKVEVIAGGNPTNRQQASNATTTTYTFSVFAKMGSGTLDANRFVLRNSTLGSSLISMTINYSTGAFSASVGTAGVTIQNAGNGWYRIGLSTSMGVNVGNSLQVQCGYTGSADAVGEYAYFYGAQLEALPYMTSYFPTISSSAQGRAKDNATIATASLGFSDVEGTMIIDTDFVMDAGNDKVAVYRGDSRFLYTTSSSPTGPRTLDSTNTLTPSSIGVANSTPFKYGLTWSDSVMFASANGNTFMSSAYDGAWGTGDIGLGTVGFAGHIRQIKYIQGFVTGSYLSFITSPGQ